MSVAAKTVSTSAIVLTDAPIPDAVVTQGKPIARIWVATQSPDKRVTQGVWDCTAGTFNWEYGWDEFVLIQEGEAIISPRDGKPFTLRPGDFAVLPSGLKVEWHIPKYVKKTFVLRSPEPMSF